MHYVTCASPAYLKRHGHPMHPNDLVHHRCVNYFSARTGKMFDWYFKQDGEQVQVSLSSHVALSDSCAYTAAGLAGLGIVQMADFLMAPMLADGRLVPILDTWTNEPLPIYMVYPQNRHLQAKVGVFVEWIARLFSNHSTLH
jgi:LysR family transcriptional regulator for bpeEF and oprC